MLNRAWIMKPLVIALLLFQIILAVHACKLGTYGKCDSWGSCSESCGGGRQSRICRSCFWGIEKRFYQDCNQFCDHGHPYNNGCQCSNWRTGRCCEICRLMPIAHCPQYKKQCGGSPDGIRCTKCDDPYYTAGYNKGCTECPSIANCKDRHCTSPADTKCDKCIDDLVFFKRTNDDTTCDRMCSWNNHYCWPGVCGAELTKNCQCAPGFKQVASSGETSCQLDTKPNILTCDTVTIGPNGEKKRAASFGNLTACESLRSMYGNFQPSSIQFSMLSEFSVDIAKYAADRPNFTEEENFGISDTTLYLNKYKPFGTVTQVAKHTQLIDVNSGQSVNTTDTRKGNLNATMHHLKYGEALCVLYEAKAGGYLKSKDFTNNIINNATPYRKVAQTEEICYRFDNAEPEHCLFYRNCSTEPLVIENRVTRSQIHFVTFTGWLDPIPEGSSSVHASSIESYQITVNEVIPSKGESNVATESKFSEKVDFSTHTVTMDLPSDTPKLYCITLEVKDVADNVKQARRFMLYDNTSSIETSPDKPFSVVSASGKTDFTWQTHHNDVCLNWKDHFINRFYFKNELLNPIKPDPFGLISGIYEQNSGLLPVSGTSNVHGIVEYMLSWSRDYGNTSSEIAVPDFLSQRFCKKIDLKDGETYTFNVRPVDIAGNTYNENRTIHIDRSAPHINHIWLRKDGYHILFVHSSTDLSQMYMTFNALDPHSGIKYIYWTFGISDTHTELTNGTLDTGTTSNEVCSNNSATCYCPDVGECEFFNYTIPLNNLVNTGKHEGNHNRNYYYTIKVTNNAMLSNTEQVDILVDDSPPETGVVYEGPTDAKDIDYTSDDSFMVHWHGFIDHESGIKMYRIGLSSRCLGKDDLYNFTDVTDILNYQEVPFTENTVRIPADFTGKRYISVIALNNAMDASEPVCSDGITRDLSPPQITNLTLQHGTWSESVVCHNGKAWLMHSTIVKIPLQNTSNCMLLCNAASFEPISQALPSKFEVEKDRDISDFLCQIFPKYNNETIIYLPNDHISLSWEIENLGSQVDNYFVGIGYDPSERNSPSIAFQTTNRKMYFKRHHEGINSNDLFYIFIKSVNKAGLSKITTFGPVLIDETPPLVKKIPKASVIENNIVVGWETDAFYDDEQQEQIDQILFQIGHNGKQVTPLMEWRLDSSKPCIGFSGGCFKYPLRRLQKQDTDIGYLFSITLHVYNNAGHFTTVVTAPFQIPSMYPPGHGIVFDLDPDYTEAITADVQVHFKEHTLCAAWAGFKHHESLLFEVGVGTDNTSDNVITFSATVKSSQYCFKSSNLEVGILYFVLVRASCSGGSSVSASDGVIIIGPNSLRSSVNVYIGKSCNNVLFYTVGNGALINFTVSKTLQIGLRYRLNIDLPSSEHCPYTLSSQNGIFENETETMTDTCIVNFIPFNKNPDISLSAKVKSITNESIGITFSECPASQFIPPDKNIDVYWLNLLNITASLRYEVGLFSKPNVNSTLKYEIPYGLTENNNAHGFQTRDLHPDISYKVALRVCSRVQCIAEIYSDAFIIEPSTQSFDIVKVEIEPATDSSCTLFKMEWLNAPHTRFFQWTISRNNKASHLVKDWTTTMPCNRTQYEVHKCIDLPIHDHTAMFGCVRAFSMAGQKSMFCRKMDIRSVGAYTTDTIYDFDANADAWKTILEILPSSNVGEMYELLHTFELDFGTSSSNPAAAILYGTDRQVTWYLTSSRVIPNDCDLDTHCKYSQTSSNGYTRFDTNLVEFNQIYYVCAYSNITTIVREFHSETLKEISSCSNGFVLDDVAPTPGYVIVDNGKGFLTDTRFVKTVWDGFKDNINTKVLGYSENLLNYKVKVGSEPNRDDIRPVEDVGLENTAVLNITGLNDASIVYVSIEAMDHSGLTSVAVSDELVIDTSPPVTGDIWVDNNDFGTFFVHDMSLTIELRGFRDDHSGLRCFEVGIGSRPETIDIMPNTKVSSERTYINLPAERLSNGHAYYILAKAVNRAGLSSAFVQRKFIMDTSPPTGGYVLDGSWIDENDTDYKTNADTIEGHWKGFVDSHSGLGYYRVGLGTHRYMTNIRTFIDVGLNKDISWNGTFNFGQKYYITVEACNGAGLCTRRSSDGIVCDNSPPITGVVYVGSNDGHQKYHSERTSVHVRWFGFEDPQSEIDHFDVCIGTQAGLCDILPNYNVLLQSNIIKTNLSLPTSTDIYATVTVYNRVMMYVHQTSSSFQIDNTPPVVVTKPKFVLEHNNIDGIHAQFEKSILRICWEFEDLESSISSHEISLVTHHEGHTPVERMLLGAEKKLTIALDGNNWLQNGDTYFVIVTSCNAAGLCTSEKSADLLIDSTPPHMGGFKPPLTWNNFQDSNNTIRSNVTLTWYGFHDQESGIEKYYITLSRSYSNQELTNGVKTVLASNNSLQESAVTFTLSETIRPDEQLILSIWAQNVVGLNSSVGRVSVNILSNTDKITDLWSLQGSLELEKHSCDAHFCNKDCTCAVIGRPCVEIERNDSCIEYNTTDVARLHLPEFRVVVGMKPVTLNISASSACLGGNWRLINNDEFNRTVHRFEWSIGIQNEKVGVGIFDLQSERPWQDIGLRTEFIHCLPINKTLEHNTKYVIYTRAWYGPDTFAVFQSDPILIDQTAPSVRKGRYIKDCESSCSQDLDFIDWTDTITACWKDVFSEQQSDIIYYLVAMGTSINSDDVLKPINASLDTTIIVSNLTLEHGVQYFFTVTAINTVGLHTTSSSDGFLVDIDDPVAGIVYNTINYNDKNYQSFMTQIGFSWHGFQDNFSGIKSYYIAMSDAENSTDSDIEFIDVGLSTEHVFDDFIPQHDKTYFGIVKAIDAAGHVSKTVVSNGIVIDNTPPIGYTCEQFGSPRTVHNATGSALILSEHLIGGILYKLSGKVYANDNVQVHMSKGRVNMWLPLALNHNNTFDFEHTFMVKYTETQNITLTTHTNSYLLPAAPMQVELLECVNLTVNSQLAVKVVQLGPRSIAVNSFIIDKESLNKIILVGAGTTPGGFQILPLTECHGDNNNFIIRSNLTHGSDVYVTVIAENHAGMTSEFYAEPITIDHTPPDITNVQAKLEVNKNSNTVKALATWDTEDDESLVKYCFCSIGSEPYLADIHASWLAQTTSSCSSDSVKMKHGDSLYVMVKCVNNVELATTGQTDKIAVSMEKPCVDDARLTFITLNVDSTQYLQKETVEHPAQTNTTSLQMQWTGFHDRSGIAEFEYRILDDNGGVFKTWTQSQNKTLATIHNLSLASGRLYKTHLRAINAGNFVSDPVTAEIIIADTGPFLSGRGLYIDREDRLLHLNWENVFTTVPNIPVFYTLVVGTRPGFSDIVDIDYSSGLAFDLDVPLSSMITPNLHEIFIQIRCTYSTGKSSVYNFQYTLV